MAAIVIIQVEICLLVCAGGDGEKTAQNVVMAAHEGSSAVVSAIQRIVQD